MKKCIIPFIAAVCVSALCLSSCSLGSGPRESSDVSQTSGSTSDSSASSGTGEVGTEVSKDDDTVVITSSSEEIEKSDKFVKEFTDKFQKDFKLKIKENQTKTGKDQSKTYSFQCNMERTSSGKEPIVYLTGVKFDSFAYTDKDYAKMLNEYFNDVLTVCNYIEMAGYDELQPKYSVMTPRGNEENIDSIAMNNAYYKYVAPDYDSLEMDESTALIFGCDVPRKHIMQDGLEYLPDHKGSYNLSAAYPDPEKESTDTVKYYVFATNDMKPDKTKFSFSLEKIDDNHYIYTEIFKYTESGNEAERKDVIEYSFE